MSSGILGDIFWDVATSSEPADPWLEHVQLSSVRLLDWGSTSFVSNDGLVVTNQHVTAARLQKLDRARSGA